MGIALVGEVSIKLILRGNDKIAVALKLAARSGRELCSVRE